MFTGIITNTGIVEKNKGGKLQINTNLAAILQLGDSIAVNGICLTVTKTYGSTFEADYVEETAERTNITDLKPGREVNLELPARPNSLLSGHIVQGHIDETAKVISLAEKKSGIEITFTINPGSTKYIVKKGSVTVDGISLTIADIKSDEFKIAVIPHTLEVTSLKHLKPGDRVNIEYDVIAKYVEKMLKEKI